MVFALSRGTVWQLGMFYCQAKIWANLEWLIPYISNHAIDMGIASEERLSPLSLSLFYTQNTANLHVFLRTPSQRRDLPIIPLSLEESCHAPGKIPSAPDSTLKSLAALLT